MVVTDKIVDTTVDMRVSSVGYVVILRTMESRRITYLLHHNQRMNDQQRANMMLEIKIVRTLTEVSAFIACKTCGVQLPDP